MGLPDQNIRFCYDSLLDDYVFYGRISYTCASCSERGTQILLGGYRRTKEGVQIPEGQSKEEFGFPYNSDGSTDNSAPLMILLTQGSLGPIASSSHPD